MTNANQPVAAADEKSPHESRYYRFATPVAVLAFIVSCLSAGFTWWQGSLIGEANELARKNNIVSQRAFVSVSLGKQLAASTVGMPLNLKQGLLQAVLEGGSEISGISFGIDLTNSGNTGTKNLTFLAKCVPSAEDLIDPWPLLTQGARNPDKTPQFIGPHATISTSCGFDIGVLKQLNDKKQFAYIMVDVAYQDRLDETKPHKTQATMRVSEAHFRQAPGPSGSLGMNSADILIAGYGRHNCADEECPQ